MKKHYVAYELEGNREGVVRILAIDKIAMEAHARRNGWELIDGPRTAAHVLFSALKREKVIDEIDFETFVETVLIDLAATDEDNAENPTQ